MDEAAAIHKQCNRKYDDARCTHMAATLCRLAGNLDDAKKCAKRAAQLVEPGTPIAISAATELGEIAILEGNGSTAVESYSKALQYGETANMIRSARSALLRKRAIALSMIGHFRKAATDLEKAYVLLIQAGEHTTARRTLIEKATALHQSNNIIEAEQASAIAMKEAETADDQHALADLYLLQSAVFIEKRDHSAAMIVVQKARECALAAVAPLSYLSATIAISELADAAGDRLSAYEALAVGWVTLSDLGGPDIPRSTIKPKLLELQTRWGAKAFSEVKSAYETRRRAEKNNTHSE